MPAREYTCTVLSVDWLTPTVFLLRFEPSRRFSFEPGQFVSVQLPGEGRPIRRIYSMASPGGRQGYELCVQKLPQGRGSSYLASLKPGETFLISAPYGDFYFETDSTRNACFVATGTGIAPFKSIIQSERFLKDPPRAAMLLFGARNESEVLFRDLFERSGLEVACALTQPAPSWNGFAGRVSDFVRALPEDWPWRETDFYLCGNGHMVRELREHLVSARRVPPRSIRQEAYFANTGTLIPLKKAA